MRRLTLKLAAALALTSTALLTGCGSSDDHPASIATTATNTASLSTLLAVAKFASNNNDLVDILSNPGTLTVFAPSNTAFDALAVELTGSATAKATDLLTDANKPLLRTVLQYHILSSKVVAANIPFGKSITPVQGSIFKIDTGTPPVITDGRNRKSNITATNIDASNGVVHLIDKVLLPANKNIVETALGLAPEFSTLVAALQFASNNNDLVTLVSGTGPFTVFAPTNKAFDDLAVELTRNPAAKAADLLTAANKPLLRDVLSYHIVTSRVLKGEIPLNTAISTALPTRSFQITPALEIADGAGRTSKIIITDVLTSNGVVHAIDKVILPVRP